MQMRDELRFINEKLARLGFQAASPARTSADGHALLFRRLEVPRESPATARPQVTETTPRERGGDRG